MIVVKVCYALVDVIALIFITVVTISTRPLIRTDSIETQGIVVAQIFSSNAIVYTRAYDVIIIEPILTATFGTAFDISKIIIYTSVMAVITCMTASYLVNNTLNQSTLFMSEVKNFPLATGQLKWLVQ